MADTKISDLTAKTSLADTDLLVLVDVAASPDETKKITVANARTSIGGATPPVAYTPTFTGFGSVSSITAYSWRVGSVLFFEIAATVGTPTATEARVSIGYNGTDGNVSTASTYPTLQMVGIAGLSGDANGVWVLAEASKSYVTFGYLGGGVGALSKRLGNGIMTGGTTISLSGSVRITGW